MAVDEPGETGRREDRLRTLAGELDALRQGLQAQLAGMAEGARPVDLDQPIGRVSRVDALQQQSMSRANRESVRQRLQRVEAALRRVEDGSYGDCLVCEEPIALGRLEARPETPLCIGCQTRREAAR